MCLRVTNVTPLTLSVTDCSHVFIMGVDNECLECLECLECTKSIAIKGWFPYDRRRSRIADRRRSQRELFPYNRRRSQRIAEPTVAIHFVQRKCQMYTRVVLAGKSKQTTWRTSRTKFFCKQIYFFF